MSTTIFSSRSFDHPLPEEAHNGQPDHNFLPVRLTTETVALARNLEPSPNVPWTMKIHPSWKACTPWESDISHCDLPGFNLAEIMKRGIGHEGFEGHGMYCRNIVLLSPLIPGSLGLRQ